MAENYIAAEIARRITPRDVARHVFRPIWAESTTSDARVEARPDNPLESVAVALPGGHSFTVTAAPGPNVTRVWTTVTASAPGSVNTSRGRTARDAEATLISWARLHGIPHRVD